MEVVEEPTPAPNVTLNATATPMPTEAPTPAPTPQEVPSVTPEPLVEQQQQQQPQEQQLQQQEEQPIATSAPWKFEVPEQPYQWPESTPIIAQPTEVAETTPIATEAPPTPEPTPKNYFFQMPNYDDPATFTDPDIVHPLDVAHQVAGKIAHRKVRKLLTNQVVAQTIAMMSQVEPHNMAGAQFTMEHANMAEANKAAARALHNKALQVNRVNHFKVKA